ncbi:hypothetical protein J6590_071881, partial [Homalodisca vitripennis]
MIMSLQTETATKAEASNSNATWTIALVSSDGRVTRDAEVTSMLGRTPYGALGPPICSPGNTCLPIHK